MRLKPLFVFRETLKPLEVRSSAEAGSEEASKLVVARVIPATRRTNCFLRLKGFFSSSNIRLHERLSFQKIYSQSPVGVKIQIYEDDKNVST